MDLVHEICYQTKNGVILMFHKQYYKVLTA